MEHMLWSHYGGLFEEWAHFFINPRQWQASAAALVHLVVVNQFALLLSLSAPLSCLASWKEMRDIEWHRSNMNSVLKHS